MPHPLGDEDPELSGRAYRSVAAARAALGALDATARQLPNPRLFRHQNLRVEAQATAALEGTYEPLARVLSAAATETQSASMREVLNFIDVANTAFGAVAEGRPLTIPLLSELQAGLMAGTDSEGPYSGQVRPIQVVVGHRPEAAATLLPVQRARYIPSPPGIDLEARLRDLLRWIDAVPGPGLDPVVAAGMAHYQFESLHPFHDGNGRLGRLLIVVHLYRAGLLSEPSLTVSPWFEARRAAYYDALFGVSAQGDWSTWIGLFADGIAASAVQTRDRMLSLTKAMREVKEQIRVGGLRTANALHLIDVAVDRLVFTTADAATALGMKPQGAAKLIESLQSLGILSSVGDRKYNRLYYAPRIADVVLSAQATG
ncbi:Fic family protein [Tessaracoccus sp.]|uniref:Fic family protein n=1 Tax=Tessaracoccus sp. TaxID=1971211 RepID=UPI00262ACAD6|nr:Fic family protein [Tessaracoccus sp.]